MTPHGAFHFPGIDSAPREHRRLGSTSLVATELTPLQVAAVWEHLDEGARVWRQETWERRIERLSRASAALRARGPGTWTDGLLATTGLSPQGLAAAWDVTFAPHGAASIAAAVEAEGIASLATTELPSRLVHVLSGNVLPATFLMLLRGWLLGAAQWLRPSEREPLFPIAVASHLLEFDPGLASTFAVSWWPHRGSRMGRKILRSASVVTAQGDDEAIAVLRRRLGRLHPGARFVGYDSRWSLALVSRASQSKATAAALAWDLALFDQQGCLSPSLVLAERHPGLVAWVDCLADALAELEERMPAGRPSAATRAGLRAWREEMRLGRALGEVLALRESCGGIAWAVALHNGCRDSTSPGHRHVTVSSFETLEEIVEVLGTRVQRTQGLVAALDGWEDGLRARALAALRPARVATPGEIQVAPVGWRQDRLPALGALLGRLAQTIKA